MKITHLFLLVFGLSFSAISQGVADIQYYKFAVLYGSKFITQDFNKQLNTAARFKFNGPVSMAGICITEDRSFGLADRIIHECEYYFAQVLPARISLNDSVSAGLSGFQIGASFFGYDFVSKKNRKNRLNFGIGFNACRLTLSNSKGLKAKNPFFSPKIGVKPRFNIGPLYLSLMLEYEYDVSKTAWKRMKNASSDQPDINNLRQSGFTAFINLGFFLNKSKAAGAGETKPKNKKRSR